MSEIRSIGSYKTLARLGSGAHSTIYHVRRSEDSKQYALKEVPIDAKDDWKFLVQAEHEFQVAQRFDHPNLVKIYALEKQRSWFFRIRRVLLLIEFVNGKTLDTVGRQSPSKLLLLFEKIANGLAHMHKRGVFHADLKPNNIMLSRAGEVKILDYGLSWIKGQPKDRVQGTPEYMAPEQSRKSIANEQTDIYNFGATMYRLTTGKLPPSTMPTGGLAIDAGTFRNLLHPVKELAPETPEPLCKLIHRCLGFKPADRPETMAPVLTELHHLAKQLAPDGTLEQ